MRSIDWKIDPRKSIDEEARKWKRGGGGEGGTSRQDITMPEMKIFCYFISIVLIFPRGCEVSKAGGWRIWSVEEWMIIVLTFISMTSPLIRWGHFYDYKKLWSNHLCHPGVIFFTFPRQLFVYLNILFPSSWISLYGEARRSWPVRKCDWCWNISVNVLIIQWV